MQLCLEGQWVLVMDYETGVSTVLNASTCNVCSVAINITCFSLVDHLYKTNFK